MASADDFYDIRLTIDIDNSTWKKKERMDNHTAWNSILIHTHLCVALRFYFAWFRLLLLHLIQFLWWHKLWIVWMWIRMRMFNFCKIQFSPISILSGHVLFLFKSFSLFYSTDKLTHNYRCIEFISLSNLSSIVVDVSASGSNQPFSVSSYTYTHGIAYGDAHYRHWFVFLYVLVGCENLFSLSRWMSLIYNRIASQNGIMWNWLEVK